MPAGEAEPLSIPPAARAAVDRIIPADRWPAGWAGGVGDYLASAGRDLEWAQPLLSALAQRLDALAGPQGFASLPAERQDELLAEAAASPDDAFAALTRVCWEGYYAASPGHEPAGLAMVGFRAVPAGVTPVEPELPPDIGSAGLAADYDAIVIGGGPGGGVAAQVLSQAGKRVLVIERSRRLPNAALRGDHLHGKRNAVYRSVVGPGPGHPRIAVLPNGDRVIDAADDAWAYGLNAMTLGGGSRIWQGMAWRFLPEDFRMASVYGNPEGASLVDWPVDYDEMEPYYTRAEHELGVAGEEGGLTTRTRRSGGYPMPAFETEPARDLLAGAAERLGWSWGPIPLALNSVPHDGRPACVRCPQCVGHACPVDAKNGSHNTFLPRAVATGNCDVLYDAEVVEVRDGAEAASVVVMTDTSTAPAERTLRAEVVVVAAGAVETARLLLASGIGNDQMGRHLHDHRFVTMLSDVDEPVKPYIGPGHSVATLDHVHAGTIPWGGGVLVDLMSLLPLTFATQGAPGVPRWGAGHKEWMRGGRANRFGVFGMGQEVPSPTSRVTLAEQARDRWGRPGAALRKDVHPTNREIEDGMAAQGGRWLEAAGAANIERQRSGPTASAAGEHSCGTARMSTSRRTGATDPYGRVWDTRRIVVCDQSLHPTNGSVNPNLTNIANAFRVAEHLAAEWPR